MQRIVLTGGPGAGKTTVLSELQQRGCQVTDDAARAIIIERKQAGLSPRPDAETFSEQILAREISAYNRATGPLVFFERGVVDVAGSLLALAARDENSVMQLVRRYTYDHVFLFPAWEDIYRQDEERDHTFEHAVRVHDGTRNWYQRAGYEPIEVPRDTPINRADFVMEHIGLHDHTRLGYRDITPEDRNWLIVLRKLTMNSHLVNAGIEPRDGGHEEAVDTDYGWTNIITHGDNDIGMIKVIKQSSPWHLRQVQVHPAYHGLGYGTRVMTRLLGEAKTASASIVLNVLHVNPAQRLYERLGFKIVESGEHARKMQWDPPVSSN